MFISIEEYNRNERSALKATPNRAIQAFGPVTFEALHIPHRVCEEAELARYVDALYESKGANYFSDAHRYSKEEAELVRWVSDEVVRFTGERFGRPIRPWISPLAAIPLFRVISALAELSGKKTLSIFEIGPGSGYLAALLIPQGHRYASMDNAQAFYLWQNRLFLELAKGGFHEMALNDSIPSPTPRVAHVPWWVYTTFHEVHPFAADIVLCDNALGEMSSSALQYVLRISHRMLSESEWGLLLFTSAGKPCMNSLSKIFYQLEEAGFVPVFLKGFYGFAPRGSAVGRFAYRYHDTFPAPTWLHLLKRKIRKGFIPKRPRGVLPQFIQLEEEVPRYNPSKEPKELCAYDFLPLSWTESPLDYPFVSFIGHKIPHVPAKSN